MAERKWQVKEASQDHCQSLKKFLKKTGKKYLEKNPKNLPKRARLIISKDAGLHLNQNEGSMKKSILVLALLPAVAFAVDRIKIYDFDQDGKVSLEDLNRYCDVSEQLFERADKNNDGYLNNSEMRTAKNYLFEGCEK